MYATRWRVRYLFQFLWSAHNRAADNADYRIVVPHHLCYSCDAHYNIVYTYVYYNTHIVAAVQCEYHAYIYVWVRGASVR